MRGRTIRKSQHRVEEVLMATAQESGVDSEGDVGSCSEAAGRDVEAGLSSLHDGNPCETF